MPNADFDFSPEAIRSRRIAVGLSLEEFALAAASSVSAVHAWEHGRRAPRERVRPLILAALGLDSCDAEHVHALNAAKERARAWLAATRKAQGLSATIEDDAAAQEIARSLRGDAA